MGIEQITWRHADGTLHIVPRIVEEPEQEIPVWVWSETGLEIPDWEILRGV